MSEILYALPDCTYPEKQDFITAGFLLSLCFCWWYLFLFFQTGCLSNSRLTWNSLRIQASPKFAGVLMLWTPQCYGYRTKPPAFLYLLVIFR